MYIHVHTLVKGVSGSGITFGWLPIEPRLVLVLSVCVVDESGVVPKESKTFGYYNNNNNNNNKNK